MSKSFIRVSNGRRAMIAGAGAALAWVTPASATSILTAFDPYRGADFSRGVVTQSPGELKYLFDNGTITARIDVDTTGYHEVWVLPGIYNAATAKFGELKAFSRVAGFLVGLPGTSAGQEGMAAGFKDTVVFNTGRPGEAGVASFRINVNGQFSTINSTLSNYGNVVPLAGFAAEISYFLRGLDYDVSGATLPPRAIADINGTRIYTVNFISGVPVDIGLQLEAYSSYIAGGYGYATATSDFSHTITWGGLMSATGSEGRDLTDSLMISSESGTNYLSDMSILAGVPEPSTWTMMLFGFGGVGLAMRRRRRSTGWARLAA